MSACVICISNVTGRQHACWNVTPVECGVTASASQVLLCCQMNEWSAAGKIQVPGTKVQGNEWSRERTVERTNGPWMERSAGFIRSREQKFPGLTVHGTNGPENESFIMGTNVSGNE